MSETNETEGGLGGLIDKAKEFLTDDKIDSVADAIKKVAPDSVDGYVDQAADKAKELND